MKHVKFNTTSIHYRVFGNGNPLVFLHGFLEDSSMWYEFIQPLLKTNQVILIDLPCHGETRFIGNNCSMLFMANCVNTVLKKESIINPTIFGHSMGGYVGLELAKLIEIKLVLIHSNFWADNSEKKHDRDRVIELVKDKKEYFIKIAIPNLFHEKNAINCYKPISVLIEKANKLPVSEICAATRGLKNRIDNSTLLIEQNIHIIQGEYDSTIPLKLMESKLKSKAPSQKIHTIKNCGHMSIWEKPKELFSIIEQFCK
jgi:pimeloyl-ACP methyl ester carboxylesterase